GENVLELHHAGIGEQQGRIVARHQGARRHDFVIVTREIVEKGAADVIGGLHGLDCGAFARPCKGRRAIYAPVGRAGRCAAGYAVWRRSARRTSSTPCRPAVSASRQCFSASASLAKLSRRQPWSARTGASSSAAIASRSSAEATSFCAT